MVYPNLYTLLVSPPGIGKTQIITPVEALWRKTKTLKVSPNSLTKAGLVDALAAASRKIILNSTTMVEFNSLVVAAGEFGVLVPAHDTDFLSVLNYIYDNPPVYDELRRMFKGETLEIKRPQLNILAGTQPAYLANLLPDEAWGMGFMSRQIMVYAGTAPKVELFASGPETSSGLQKIIEDDLTAITKLYGEVKWEEAAKTELVRWYKSGMEPVPEHSKLSHYTSRRILHTLKLCIISSVSRGTDFIITHYDVNRAREWLLTAEHTMPDVFRDMVSRSDSQVIQELHFFLFRLWAKEQRGIHESRLIHFLQHRVPADRVGRVLHVAEQANIIARLAGTDTYKPIPKDQHGVE